MALKNIIVSWGGSKKIVILLIVYLLYLFVFTLMPFTFSLSPSWSIDGFLDLQHQALSSISYLPLLELLQNVLLFTPLGFLLVTLPFVSRYPLPLQLTLSVCSSCALSGMIEFCQIFLPRTPSMVDVVLNTMGGVCGAILGMYTYRFLGRVSRRCWRDVQKSHLLPLLVGVYVFALVDVSSLTIIGTDFSNWDQTFPFQLGNEATLNRTWLGEMYLVALYDRVLTPQEVHRHYRAGPSAAESSARTREGLVALYSFVEGGGTVVRDRSQWGASLDLHIDDSNKVRWMTPNGIQFFDRTIVKSAGSAEKLCRRDMCELSRLSVEAWVSPANLEQKGPARIVSYSLNPSLRNFTLAQEQREIVFRIRTPLSGLNGIQQAMQTSVAPLTTKRHHIVATYRNGVTTLFVDGRQHEVRAADGREHLTLFYTTGKWAFWFVALFPVGFLLFMLFSRMTDSATHAIYGTMAIGLMILLTIEGISMILTNREVDLFLIVIGTGIVGISALASSVFWVNREVSARL